MTTVNMYSVLKAWPTCDLSYTPVELLDFILHNCDTTTLQNMSTGRHIHTSERPQSFSHCLQGGVLLSQHRGTHKVKTMPPLLLQLAKVHVQVRRQEPSQLSTLHLFQQEKPSERTGGLARYQTNNCFH